MAKITLRDPTSGFNSASQHTANNDDLEDHLNNKVLYRDNPDGEANAMQNDLDMNSNRILNLPTATNSAEPVTYGQFTEASTTVTFTGTSVQEFTATAGQTAFTLTTTSYTQGASNLSVYINGVLQHPSSYTETSTTVFTLSAGAEAGDAVLAVVNERTVDATVTAASSITFTPTGGAATDVQSYLSTTSSTASDGDTTPSVDGVDILTTANTASTTISDFDGGLAGQRLLVKIGDANTTIDFTGTDLKGNAGVDWTPASGDAMICVCDGTSWFCSLVDVA